MCRLRHSALRSKTRSSIGWRAVAAARANLCRAAKLSTKGSSAFVRTSLYGGDALLEVDEHVTGGYKPRHPHHQGLNDLLKKITVFLPIAYRGGSLRVTKTIARMLRAGSKAAGSQCEITIAILEGKYDIEDEFRDVVQDGITVREFSWLPQSQDEIRLANALQGRHVELRDAEYQMPQDGVRNFMDSDLWFIVSDRTARPLAPVRPYVLFATDYIQRYVPHIFESSGWGSVDTPFIRSAQNANAVITTTPQTMKDAISYAGIRADKVMLAPMDFDPTAFPTVQDTTSRKEDHIIWATNPAQHKNHVRAFEALRRYFENYNGRFDVKVVGANTAWLDPRKKIHEDIGKIEHVSSARHAYGNSKTLRRRVEILGEVDDRQYAKVVASAQFMWHPTIYDNGTFAVAEAAWLRTPILSSGYPQMRYISDRFGIPMPFFDPINVEEMASTLKEMENNVEGFADALPSHEILSRYSWENVAGEYWDIIRRVEL